MTIRIKVSPNSRCSEILGWEDHPGAGRVLRVRLAAPPVEGKANKALVAFLAAELGLPKSAVRLAKGAASRIKTLEIPDQTPLPPHEA